MKTKAIQVFPAGTHQALKEVLKGLTPEMRSELARIEAEERDNVMNPPGRKVAKKAKKQHQAKGVKKTSDYLNFDEATRKGQALLWGKRPVIGFYIIFSINTGCRVSDVMEVKHSDMEGKQPGDGLTITEQKTGKDRELTLNNNVIQAYADLTSQLKARGIFRGDDYIFKSQKNSVFVTSTLNRMLKREFKGYARNVSTHSLRKTYGRRVYERNGKGEDALIRLSQVFGHSNISITRRYLGFTKEMISDLYMNL